jgi:hypothetical protein
MSPLRLWDSRKESIDTVDIAYSGQVQSGLGEGKRKASDKHCKNGQKNIVKLSLTQETGVGSD